MAVLLAEGVFGGLAERRVGHLLEFDELMRGGAVDERQEHHLVGPALDRRVEGGEMGLGLHDLVPVDAELLEQAAEAEVMAVFLHHRLGHALLELGRGAPKDAAFEAIGAVVLAHHVDVDEVEDEFLELGILPAEIRRVDVGDLGLSVELGHVVHSLIYS